MFRTSLDTIITSSNDIVPAALVHSPITIQTQAITSHFYTTLATSTDGDGWFSRRSEDITTTSRGGFRILIKIL